MKKIIFGILLSLVAASSVFAQSAIIRGEVSAGSYINLKANSGGYLLPPITDPCLSAGVTKSNVAIGITSATTTELVALTAAQTIFVCDFTFTISQVVTTANTLKFVYGTGTACATGGVDITGLFGAGGITAGIPISITSSGSGTKFAALVANALCATTAIGASGSFQGVLTYVKQ